MVNVGSNEWNQQVVDLLGIVDELPALLDAGVMAIDALTPAVAGAAVILVCTASDPLGSYWLYPMSARPFLPNEVPPWRPEEDPFISALTRGRRGCILLRDELPLEIEDSHYFKEAYSKYGFSDGIAHGCRVGQLYVCIGRTSVDLLTDEDISRHRSASPVILEAARRIGLRFWKSGPERSVQPNSSVEAAMNLFGSEILTPREMEVIGLVLRGHNTESITHQLEISPNTIKRHRTSAYKKFGVSTQGELFYRFLESLGMSSKA